MHASTDSLAHALAGARDVTGAGRLVALLGYDLLASPVGAAFDAATDGALPDDDVELRHIASGGGIHVVVPHEAADSATPVARATRIRTLLGGGPRPVLLVWPSCDGLTVATGGLDGRPRALTVSRDAPRPTELDALRELAARDDGALAALSRHARALDRSALSRRFFRDFRAQRDAISRAWTGLPERARRDRDQLALLFLSRLVFLYFLQKQGQLLGRESYLIDLLRDAALHPDARSIHARVLRPLFFGVLNTPPASRGADARVLGELPYLNGGLFEPHALERTHPDLDLPDDAVLRVFEDLLERYRFTASEREDAAADTHAIQPEMLGRVFEGLMSADRRAASGTFYTPAAVVDRIVRRALQAWLAGRPGMDWRAAGMLLRESPPSYGQNAAQRAQLLAAVREIRVLDPACGSGAFVLGSLERLAQLRRSLGDATERPDLLRDLAAHALHGVDAEADAALLCALRLWLALTPRRGTPAAEVRPLPNLDHRVRQGDALLDPMELAGRGDAVAEVWRAAALDPGVRRVRRLMAALIRRYGAAAADERARLRARLSRCELRLARRWIDGALRRLDEARRSVHARARERDLFGSRAPDRRAWRAEVARLRDARAELRRLDRRLRERAALPFFSFAVHFGADDARADSSGSAANGFDLVVSNPPWVRSHKWPRAFNALIRSRYRVCREPGWSAPTEAEGRRTTAGQVDLALLFVERGLDLLGPGGVLALLLPAKAYRSLSAGAARSLVLERADILALEDHSLHHRAIFRADAFAGVVVARAKDPAATRSRGDATAVPAPAVSVTMTHRTSEPLRFRTRLSTLPLDREDPRSPWLLAPPDVRRALRRLQRHGRPLGRHEGLGPRRGAMTGDNEVLLFERAERKLGDAVVAWQRPLGDGNDATRPAGAERTESSVLLRVDDVCPVVRGAGIRPFRYDTRGFVVWCHDDRTAAPRAPSPRLARHLAPVQARLRARAGWNPRLPDGALFRIDAAMLTARVAWRDIAPDLEVVRLPARARALGTERPLVALNTVYFVPASDDETAFALTALLSSIPCRVFARTIAERAKDARFRFLAWTVATIPLPIPWREPGHLQRLAELGERAHAEAGDSTPTSNVRPELDAYACDLYRMRDRDVAALHRFDHWLAGSGGPEPARIR